MKRSQMLQDLKEEMMTLKRYVGEVSDDEMVERLLNCAERLGMVPPMIEEKSFYLADNGEEIYATHEWDEE